MYSVEKCARRLVNVYYNVLDKHESKT